MSSTPMVRGVRPPRTPRPGMELFGRKTRVYQGRTVKTLTKIVLFHDMTALNLRHDTVAFEGNLDRDDHVLISAGRDVHVNLADNQLAQVAGNDTARDFRIGWSA